MNGVLQDVRFSMRQLRKDLGFTCTAILVLATGLAASTAIFAFVDAALIKPLPYSEPWRLVDVTESVAMIPRANLSYFDYLDWKNLNRVFSSFDVHASAGYILRTGDGVEPVPAARVSSGFFRTLGVTLLLGRDFYAGEDSPSATPAVILTYDTWQHRFGGRPDIIGQSIALNDIAHTVVGILPRDFQFAPRGNVGFWATLQADRPCEKRRSCHNLYGVAGLKNGVSIQAALANTQAIAKQLEQQYPDSNRGQGASVLPLSEVVTRDVRLILLILLGGAGLLFAIACVNVASLLLVRSQGRLRELAVRRALGASPARMARQFVTESLVLVTVAGLLGLLVAYELTHILVGLMSKDMTFRLPFLLGLTLNMRVLAFVGCMSGLAAILFSLTPMTRARLTKLHEALSEAGRGFAGTAWRRLGSNLVVVELAVAMVLLVGAA